jgi:hypothetical protein
LSEAFFDFPDSKEEYSEDFETFSTTPAPGVLNNDWEAEPFSSSLFSWTVNSGSTPSTATGPQGDHTTGNGNYIYTEASNGSYGSVTILTSPCLDASNIANMAVVSFWYHMYGSDINRLYIEYLNSNQEWITFDSIIGQQQTSNADAWKNKIAFVPADQLHKIRFRAIRGNSYEGDIAIDDIYIGQATDTNMVALSINGPDASCVLGNNETVTMTVMNMGTDTVSSFYLSYSLDTGNTWITEQINQVLAPGQTYTYTFNNGADFSIPGEYMLTGLVGILNDTIHSDDTAYGYVTHIPTVDSFEYFIDFENGENYWSQKLLSLAYVLLQG